MHRIFVILTNPLTARACLAACAKLAKSFAAVELTLLHIISEQNSDLMLGIEVYTEERRAEFEGMRNKVSSEISYAVVPGPRTDSPGLKLIRGKLEEAAKQAVDGADLIIMGGPHADPDAKIILDYALLAIKKPIILVSRNAPASVGQNIVIAWAPGEASQRAVDAIQPLLINAEYLTLLMGTSGNEFLGEPPRELFLALEVAGRDLRRHVFELADRHIGEALISEAHDVGADLLVMGAFTRDHLAETVFSGATAEILQDFDIPVLM